jgi:glycosyltransferase involved in cell wall biosynthesis
MYQPGTITVVIPAYNAEATLGRALDSVLAQSKRVDQIVVIDDGSTDGTRAISTSFAGHGVEVIELPRQSGAAVARNAGILTARGEFLAFLDADDEWHPDKSHLQMDVILKNPNMVLVSCHAAFISNHPKSNKLANYGRQPVTGGEAWKALLAYPFITASSVIARRDAVIAVGMFDPETCPAEDQDLWIKLARRGEVGFVQDTLVRYYDTPGSVSKIRPILGRAKMIGVVERHIAAAGELLTPRERRRIRAIRYSWLGRTAYAEGDLRHGLPFIIRAMYMGHEPWRNLRYLVLASPPSQWLKHWLRWFMDRNYNSA